MGREREVEALGRLLGQHRLVTVIGTGGVGKTRLALQTATELERKYRDGAWIVDLAAVADPAIVPAAAAAALAIREQPGRTMSEALTDLLRGRHVLLLLDNCEHLLQATAEFSAELLRACPELTVLATSRAPLRVAGEVALPLPPLDSPPETAADGNDDQEFADFPAVRLFMERAAQVAPGSAWSGLDLRQIGGIVRRLDGLPLAIELAAARANVLSPAEILERLDDRLSLLTRGESTAQPRHQTLIATLDWSFALLSSDERVLLRRLGVFVGGFELAAAERVAGTDPIAPPAVLDLLTQLVDRSLVMVEPRSPRSRYRLLETLREYALRQLDAAGERGPMQRRHRDWCVTLVEEAEPHLRRSEQVEWLERLELERANIRAALTYSEEADDAGLNLGRLTSALGWFWYLHGHLTEGRRWLEAALSLAATTPNYAQAAAYLYIGMLMVGQGVIPPALRWFEESIKVARDAGDKPALSHALSMLSYVLRESGRYGEATDAAREALIQAKAAGFEWGVAFALYQNGVMAYFASKPEEGWRFFEESLQRFRAIGDRLGIAYSLHGLSGREEERDVPLAISMNREAMELSEEIGNRRGVCFSVENLAMLAVREGADDDAVGYYRRALKLWRELRNVHQSARALAGLGAVLAVGRDKASAVKLFGASDVLMTESGGVLRSDSREAIGYERAVAAARDALGKKAFERAWSAGRMLDLDSAIEFAMTCGVDAGQAEPDPLSRREREVAVMLGRGLTNREIARDMVISKQTVDRHVSNILRKLRFERRSQVAAWLVEQRRT